MLIPCIPLIFLAEIRFPPGFSLAPILANQCSCCTIANHYERVFVSVQFLVFPSSTTLSAKISSGSDSRYTHVVFEKVYMTWLNILKASQHDTTISRLTRFSSWSRQRIDTRKSTDCQLSRHQRATNVYGVAFVSESNMRSIVQRIDYYAN